MLLNAIEERWIKNGKFHRVGAPARIIIHHKAWFKDGKMHRPGNDYIEYYKNGQFNRRVV